MASQRPGQSSIHLPRHGFELSELPQYPELRLSRRFPGVVAKVFWAEEIVLVLHGPNTALRFPMTLLCQEQCTPAVSVLKDRGENFAFRFLCYVACVLTWLRYQGYTLLDLGETNMGIRMDSVASPQPVVQFFDALSWRKELRTDGKWTGFHKLAAKVCPTHSRWLKMGQWQMAPCPWRRWPKRVRLSPFDVASFQPRDKPAHGSVLLAQVIKCVKG